MGAPGQVRSVGDLEGPPVSRRAWLAVGYEELSHLTNHGRVDRCDPPGGSRPKRHTGHWSCRHKPDIRERVAHLKN